MLLNGIIIILLVVLAGTFAGLTLALFSLRLTNLEAKMRLGDERAKKVYAIRKKGNLLLCTLLLGNVASYTIMTIFLDSLTTGLIAGITATALIFIFGEILPQALFPRYALAIGSKLHWFVKGTVILFYPLSAPIAWLLDRLIGRETPVLWSKEELGELIKYHEDVGDGIIDQDEERIILGALSFSELEVREIMIPKDDVFCMEKQSLVDKDRLAEIRKKGFSRIPVVAKVKQKVIGIIHTKNLIGIRPGETAKKLSTTDQLMEVSQNMKLDELLDLFIRRKMHMAIVVDDHRHFIGLVTLEDIMEEILKTEIDDKVGLE